MSKLVKDEFRRKDKSVVRIPADGNLDGGQDESHGAKGKDTTGRKKIDELEQQEDIFYISKTLENTYQSGPHKRFPYCAVREILKDVLTCHLQEEKYDVQRSRELIITLSGIIKSRVKELEISRYKIIVLIHMGQLDEQGMQITSSFLWDASNDTFASFCFKNSSLFCVATVYAVYYE
ncbi:dynein light chain Tctex-type 5 [Xenentodon cancila]